MTAVRPYSGAGILLGVTGGIASYKSAWLARLLTKAGASVDVVMTPAATEFVGAITFEALTGRPVHTGLFDPGRALDHIKLARSATAIVVAPATADFLARAAAGQAMICLGLPVGGSGPVLLVPAMNDHIGRIRKRSRTSRILGAGTDSSRRGMLAPGKAPAGPHART